MKGINNLVFINGLTKQAAEINMAQYRHTFRHFLYRVADSSIEDRVIDCRGQADRVRA